MLEPSKIQFMAPKGGCHVRFNKGCSDLLDPAYIFVAITATNYICDESEYGIMSPCPFAKHAPLRMSSARAVALRNPIRNPITISAWCFFVAYRDIIMIARGLKSTGGPSWRFLASDSSQIGWALAFICLSLQDSSNASDN